MRSSTILFAFMVLVAGRGLSFAVDPATPLSTAEAVAESLGNARVVAFANVAHGSSNAARCANGILREFLDAPDPAALDVDCAAKVERPPFLQ